MDSSHLRGSGEQTKMRGVDVVEHVEGGSGTSEQGTYKPSPFVFRLNFDVGVLGWECCGS